MKRAFLNFGTACLVCGLVYAAEPEKNNNVDMMQYCIKSGGEVVKRVPYYNTNGPESEWLQLMGSEKFCQFTAEDGSRIHITLETLYSDKPSLAALAYHFKPTPEQHDSSANPSSFYCSQLGGTDLFGGVNLNGGGWVNKATVDVVLSACIFPDMSSIDSWGLFYNANGIIRGIDLNQVMRFHPEQTASAAHRAPVQRASSETMKKPGSPQ